MSGCIFDRLDSLDTAINIPKESSRLIYVASENKIFVAWVDCGGASTTRQVRFAKYDPDTLTPSGEVLVHDFNNSFNPTTINSVDMIRMASGRLVIVVYSSAAGGSFAALSVAMDSVDSGATWGSPVTASTTANEAVYGVADDGTNLVLLTVGAASADITAWHRTGAVDLTAGTGAWGTGTKVYDANGTTLRPWDNGIAAQVRLGCYMQTALIGFIAGWKGLNSVSNTTNQMSALYTADGWATATEVLIKGFTAGGGNSTIHHVVTASGRVYLAFHNPDSNSRPYLAYTDNAGLTWTTIGTPTIVTTTMAARGIAAIDPSFDLAFTLDAQENLIVCHASANAVTPDGFHATYRSVGDPTSLANWVLAAECSYTSATNTWATATAGHAVVVGADVFRLCTMVRGASFFTLEFFFVASAAITEEPEEPAEESESTESAADECNLMLRYDASGGGVSVHQVEASCAMTWDEGDKETGTARDILVIGSPSIDATAQAAERIGAMYRIETEGDMGYGRRVYWDAASDQETTRLDPLRAIAKSKVYTLKGEFDVNVVRGFVVEYIKAGLGTLPVQVWVDGALHDVVELESTEGELNEKRFWALPPYDGVGNHVQFLIDETSIDYWRVNKWGVMLIEKKIRG